jgi:hypothetical protein
MSQESSELRVWVSKSLMAQVRFSLHHSLTCWTPCVALPHHSFMPVISQHGNLCKLRAGTRYHTTRMPGLCPAK